MSTSKSRLLWGEVPLGVRVEIGRLAGAAVVAAQNCPGGFSPGLASRLTLSDGRRAFVKAMDADAWPHEAVTHRAEASIAAALPDNVPAPRLRGVYDDGRWVALVFEDIDGSEPASPWQIGELGRVVAALDGMADVLTPSPIAVPADHPRLGGWAELAADPAVAQLPAHSAWAARNLDWLIEWERLGLESARGDSLVHFDVYAHNLLLTPDRVVLVDWPHARLGNSLVDLVLLLSSAAADGIDPQPFVADRTVAEQATMDAILVAHAGFLMSGGLSEVPPGLEAIPKAKLQLAGGALSWLRRRTYLDPALR